MTPTTRRIRTGLAALALTAGTVLALPTTANAAPARPTAPPPAADGYFYAWLHAGQNGTSCRWSGNSTNWNSGCSLRNQASSVLNFGYEETYDDVRMYWGLSYGGASYCVARGVYLDNLANYTFPNNGSGAGQSLNDNISSHKWVTGC
ncbi:peptidase inhibitor family I36 protein [Streptomyces sp. NPDC003077]|uniref:peptidase inhibitor family I36 protein n=1 Tax=Streptomyces sp. NPDC003077 TaxID=3154443 RepID=UPI0033A6C9E5